MADLNELKAAIKEMLNENGTLNKVRAEIRENIFKVIENNDNPKPKIPEENLIINELIREYFNYMGYYHSSSVFLSESGHPEDPPVDRNFISKELNIIEENNSKSIPLLYSILFGLKKEVYNPMHGNESISMNNVNNLNNMNSMNNMNNMNNMNSNSNNMYSNTNNSNNMNPLMSQNNNYNNSSNNQSQQKFNKDQPKGIVFNNS